MKKSCIVIPCFNEANRFKADEFLEFIHSVEDVDLCFVNDGSKDQTLEKLREIKGRSSERIEVVSYPDNRGKAEAVREGFLKLVALKKYDSIAFADADLATPLSEMLRLIRMAQQKQELLMVMGSRLERVGGTIQRKFHRHITGRIFAFAVSVLFSLNAHDTQCGAKVFQASVVEEVFGESFISRWLFDVEMLLRIKKKYPNYNQVVVEEPLNVWIEQGESKIRFTHLLKMPFQLCKIYFRYH
jgi:glycosyltransferase involved in cell wall biosynthesis